MHFPDKWHKSTKNICNISPHDPKSAHMQAQVNPFMPVILRISCRVKDNCDDGIDVGNVDQTVAVDIGHVIITSTKDGTDEIVDVTDVDHVITIRVAVHLGSDGQYLAEFFPVVGIAVGFQRLFGDIER